MVEQYSIVNLYHIYFIHLPVEGYLDSFHVLATVNSASLNMGVHVCWLMTDFSRYNAKECDY